MAENKNFFSTLIELLSSNYDNKPTENEKYAEQLFNVHEEFVQRNKKLTVLLENFVTQREARVRTNNFFKIFMFWFFVGILAILTATLIVFIANNIVVKTTFTTISLISISVTYLTSLIGIFQIMSKYLFPVDEEKDTISMIKTVINNDIQVEDLMLKAMKKTNYVDIEHLKTLKELKDANIITESEFTELKEKILHKI